jgi:hypothetical protein
MSVKYTVRHNDQVIGTRKSAGHREPIYTHAVVGWGHGVSGKVLSYSSSLHLAQKEASRRQGWGYTIEVLPVEAQVTTKKAAPAPTVAPVSWKVEVQADSTGTWAGNGQRYQFKIEAEDAARDLEWRWLAVKAWRVVETQDPVNVTEREPRTAAGSLD